MFPYFSDYYSISFLSSIALLALKKSSDMNFTNSYHIVFTQPPFLNGSIPNAFSLLSMHLFLDVLGFVKALQDSESSTQADEEEDMALD